MKKCKVCGCEIINGVNGCTWFGDVCTPCHGGWPKYPAPIKAERLNADDLDTLEARCLDMGEHVDP